MNPLQALSDYQGYLIGAAVLGGALVLNVFSFRMRWSSYPTLEAYVAAHPAAGRSGRAICHRCRSEPQSMRVPGRGRIYRCEFCETELYRVDRAA